MDMVKAFFTEEKQAQGDERSPGDTKSGAEPGSGHRAIF